MLQFTMNFLCGGFFFFPSSTFLHPKMLGTKKTHKIPIRKGRVPKTPTNFLIWTSFGQPIRGPPSQNRDPTLVGIFGGPPVWCCCGRRCCLQIEDLQQTCKRLYPLIKSHTIFIV